MSRQETEAEEGRYNAPVDDGDVGAGLRERIAKRFADPAVTAGDDDGACGNASAQPPPRSLRHGYTWELDRCGGRKWRRHGGRAKQSEERLRSGKCRD